MGAAAPVAAGVVEVSELDGLRLSLLPLSLPLEPAEAPEDAEDLEAPEVLRKKNGEFHKRLPRGIQSLHGGGRSGNGESGGGRRARGGGGGCTAAATDAAGGRSVEGEVVGLSEDAVQLLGARDEVDLVAGAAGPSGGGGVHLDGAQASDDEGVKDLLVVGEDVL